MKPSTPPARGRPPKSAEDRAAMKEKIAETALRLFQSEGYATISIRRLATEVGCAPMTLYQHFDAKIDILRTLWDAVFIEVAARLEAASAATDASERLRAIGAAYVAYWRENEAHYRLVFMTEGVDQQDVAAFVGNPNVGRCFALFDDAIRRQAPDLPDEMVALRRDFFVCLLQGVAHNHITISGFPWSAAQDLVDEAVKAWRRAEP